MRTNIEAERVRNQLTMSALAKKLGICAKTYSDYAKGRAPIPSDTLVEMSKLFHCSTDYLLGLDGNQSGA